MSKQTLEQELLKDFLMLERYKPETLEVITNNLELAVKNIIDFISNTQNKAKIRTFIKKEMNVAFSELDTLLLDDIDKITDVTWSKTATTMSHFLAKDLVQKIPKAMPKRVKEKLLNPNRDLMGNNINDFKSSFIYNNNNKLRQTIFNGFEKNLSTPQIAKELKHIIASTHRNQLKTVVKTSLFSAINEAKDEMFSDIFKDDKSIVWRYTSALDTRTSLYCMTANGYTTKDKSKAKYKPNSHYNCRSMWTIESDLVKTQKVVQWDGKTVNHRDGTHSTKYKVSSVKRIDKNSTPKQVFDSFDEKYQIKYMGKKRFELYKQGRLKYSEMIDIQRNKFIPLKELI